MAANKIILFAKGQKNLKVINRSFFFKNDNYIYEFRLKNKKKPASPFLGNAFLK